MNYQKHILFISLLLISGAVMSQEKKKALTITGYVSSVQSALFDSLSGPFINDNLLHNRLNFNIRASDKVTFAAEFRNRLFTGDILKLGPSYADLIGSDQGFVDMSWNVIKEPSLLFNVTMDRLWTDINLGKIEVRAGRQRINWGQTMIWNPNDIFNAYSYFDFDYIERPGSDAIRIQYYPGPSSTAELAVKADNNNRITSAALYRFNKFGFDIQFLAGVVNSEDLTIGTGWSGEIGSISFSGEATWFNPYRGINKGNTGLATTGFQKTFSNSSSAQLQLMVCNRPFELTSFTSLYSGSISAKDLAFSKFSAFGGYSYQVTPLFNLGASAIWFPDLKGYFGGFSADYSLAENVDFTFLLQHFRGNISGGRTTLNIGYLRFKFSF